MIMNILCILSSARSPVFTHLSNTLQGLVTVRAFESQNVFMDQFDEFQVC